jgi:tetratricopeptide (TPR) repeat protein
LARHDGLERLLKLDPDNLALLADAAEAALQEGKLDHCDAHLKACEAGVGARDPRVQNVRGLLALRQENYERAAECFGAALKATDDPGLRFNHAWSKAMLGRFEEAADSLDDRAALAAPMGPMLKVRALHHLGRLEEAIETGLRLRGVRGDDRELAGAISVVALDADQVELARTMAMEGGEAPDALSTRGVLALDQGDAEGSLAAFDHILARHPNNPRALAGKGLCVLARDAKQAAQLLDRAAEIFVSHSGTWVAAGWAHFVANDFSTSRARFEKAVSLDPTFSEGHGGLAVLDVVTDDLKAARKRAETAIRLDRQSFGGALVNVMLLDRAGKHKEAQRIRDMAFAVPIGADGTTLVQAMAKFGLRGPVN